MAEVTFPEVKDRNVATPSRVRITKAVGIEDDNVFDVEAVPGTVYEEGTPLNKEFFDKLKLYMDNNVGSPDNPVPIENGGTGANTSEGARENLEVYSTTEVDEIVERAGAKIDPHINSKVTDLPEGVHGLYIDGKRQMWIDPDGDGIYDVAIPVKDELGGFASFEQIISLTTDIAILHFDSDLDALTSDQKQDLIVLWEFPNDATQSMGNYDSNGKRYYCEVGA